MTTKLPSLVPPQEIWRDDVLFLPQPLVRDYEAELRHIGRFADACGEAPKGDIGGVDEKSTHDHFAFKFGASAVRTEYVLLDPFSRLLPLSQKLIETFTDGRISV